VFVFVLCFYVYEVRVCLCGICGIVVFVCVCEIVCVCFLCVCDSSEVDRWQFSAGVLRVLVIPAWYSVNRRFFF
jgi:hypothetical protein